VQINHDGKPQFIHRTFAEYYVADFLINQLTKRTKQHIHVQEFLLNTILFRRDCHVIRAFLDGLLEKSKPSNEVLKEYGEILDQQWNEGEVLSRLIGLLHTALSRAATEDNTHIIGFLLNSLKSGEHSNAQLKLELLLAKSEDGKSLMNAAARGGNLELFESLWSWSKEAQLEPNELYILLLEKDPYGYTVWHAAAKGGNLALFESLCSWAKEAQLKPDELSELLLAKDIYGKTALHEAAESGNLEVLKALWIWAKEAQLKPNDLKELLLAKDKYGDTVWHAAAEVGNLELFESLWRWAKEA
jgi:hypothetical protein